MYPFRHVRYKEAARYRPQTLMPLALEVYSFVRSFNVLILPVVNRGRWISIRCSPPVLPPEDRVGEPRRKQDYHQVSPVRGRLQ